MDRTTRTSEKTAALRRYFEQAEPADAAWAFAVLTGRKLIRAAPRGRLRAWAADEAGLSPWLLDECYAAVGDLSETLALVLPPPMEDAVRDEPLREVIERRILPLPLMTEAEQERSVRDTWRSFGPEQRFLFHKLISGTFRFGAAKKVVVNALAAAAGVDPAVMQHRAGGRFEPTPEAFAALLEGGEDDPARPYPFFLAHQLDDDPANVLGDVSAWSAEWKWDGIRCQMIRRAGRTVLWSRGDEVVTDTFPELRAAADALPDGVVLDGEVLAWSPGAAAPLPFADLQRRLNRKRVEATLFVDTPVVFQAYDLLEEHGEDLRERPTEERRRRLEVLFAERLADEPDLRLSPTVDASSWEGLAERRGESRERGVEGLMLKRKDAAYGVGRTDKGRWWKWKVAPYTVDCVMVYAQRGSGRRSSLYTDYTFAVWDGAERGEGSLVPVTKAYSGLTDEEFAKVDRFIRDHSTGKRGAFRQVEPVQVFEIAFEGIRASDRHKSGIALRFPRMARWRTDKTPDEADTLGFLQELLAGTRRAGAGSGLGVTQ